MQVILFRTKPECRAHESARRIPGSSAGLPVGTGIAGDYNCPVWGLKAITEGIRYFSMMHSGGLHLQILVLVDNTGLDFMYIHFVAGAVGVSSPAVLS
jgi:hypothetical protein